MAGRMAGWLDGLMAGWLDPHVYKYLKFKEPHISPIKVSRRGKHPSGSKIPAKTKTNQQTQQELEWFQGSSRLRVMSHPRTLTQAEVLPGGLSSRNCSWVNIHSQ